MGRAKPRFPEKLRVSHGANPPIDDQPTEAFQQSERVDADFGKEGVDEVRSERSRVHDFRLSAAEPGTETLSSREAIER